VVAMIITHITYTMPNLMVIKKDLNYLEQRSTLDFVIEISVKEQQDHLKLRLNMFQWALIKMEMIS